jgi:hypothetical protein
VRELNTIYDLAPNIADSHTLALVINSEADINLPYSTSPIINPDSKS